MTMGVGGWLGSAMVGGWGVRREERWCRTLCVHLGGDSAPELGPEHLRFFARAPLQSHHPHRTGDQHTHTHTHTLTSRPCPNECFLE
jgi:hypothetical protein